MPYRCCCKGRVWGHFCSIPPRLPYAVYHHADYSYIVIDCFDYTILLTKWGTCCSRGFKRELAKFWHCWAFWIILSGGKMQTGVVALAPFKGLPLHQSFPAIGLWISSLGSLEASLLASSSIEGWKISRQGQFLHSSLLFGLFLSIRPSLLSSI